MSNWVRCNHLVTRDMLIRRGKRKEKPYVVFCEGWIEHRIRILGWFIECQELNTCENPRGGEFLGMLLRGESHVSYDLSVKITATAAYLTVVVRMRTEMWCELMH